MKLHILTPFDNLKNLGKAYNEAMALIPDGDTACIMDYDAMLLTPDAPKHIHEYATQNPDALLTCYTNRIHQLSPQLYGVKPDEDSDIKNHIRIAEAQKSLLYKVKPIEILSGFLMVIPKSLWQKYPFIENGGCLGVDSNYRERLNADGVPILLMCGIYCWHGYRLLQGVGDKRHLI